MKIEQIYTGCLAQGAYYIVSKGEAAIIDPLREIRPYLERAEKDGVQIRYVFETHFHADFVSGHLDLSGATGAPVIYGPGANPSFEAHIAEDGEEFPLGDACIRVLHTPGHTLESSCYLLMDEHSKPHAVFTGDTLFIGDVGRPDLAQKGTLPQEELAAILYRSLREKIMLLPDEVLVYPAHGAGSACGKNMSRETVSTIGQQKKSNYALRADMTVEEFVKEVTEGLLPPPAYFPQNVTLNREGYDSIQLVMERGMKALEAEAFEQAAQATGALLLDTRDPGAFSRGFIPGSVNIGLEGTFAPWVGALVPDIRQPLLLITGPGKEEETVLRLARVGYEQVIGYLLGGFDAWKQTGKETDSITRISARELAGALSSGDAPLVIDVRRPPEYEAGHVKEALNLPLDFINEHLQDFPKDRPFVIHCGGGYRSMITASILKSRGWSNFTEVEGGFSAIRQSAGSEQLAIGSRAPSNARGKE